MRTCIVVILAAAAAFAAGCGGSEPTSGGGTTGTDGGKTVTVDLATQNDSGESGTATLTGQGSRTNVVLALENPASDSPQPAHIHKGTCADLDPEPSYPLANVVGGASETTVDVPLEELKDGRFAINVHKSDAEAEVDVAGGNLGEAPAEEDGGGYGY
jgi:hypothetical protein